MAAYLPQPSVLPAVQLDANLEEHMVEPWTVTSSRITYEDPWLKIRSDRCVTHDGQVVEPYHVLEYPTWVTVVALTEDGQLVLVREYRHGIGKVLTGLPCGCVDRHDPDVETAVRRELQEETGFGGGQFFAIGCTYGNPANQNNVCWSYLAVGVHVQQDQQLDPHEHIEIVFTSFADFIQQSWHGSIQLQGVQIATLHFALNFILSSRLPELQQLRQELRGFLLGMGDQDVVDRSIATSTNGEVLAGPRNR
jgi:ADP-ribose pyrophosphatase